MRCIMFSRTSTYFSILFLSTCVIAYWDHVHLRPKDRTSYERIVRENGIQHARHALETHPATQNRQQVQKDFWIPQGFARQHLRVICKESELILHERKGKLEAVEKLHGLECWLQEVGSHSILKKEAQSSQLMRHLTAEEGCYFYPSQHFLAQTVQLQFFRLPGTDLPNSIDLNLAFLSGTAREASFSACGRNATFTAEHLHASYAPTRGLP